MKVINLLSLHGLDKSEIRGLNHTQKNKNQHIVFISIARGRVLYGDIRKMKEAI